MGELFGVVVIAVSSLMLFAVSSVQVARRLGAFGGTLTEMFALPELDELPVRVVAGTALAIAVSSQLPVAYLLGQPAGHLSATSGVLLAIEVGAAFAWTADLAGVRRVGLRLAGRRTAVKLPHIGARSRKAA